MRLHPAIKNGEAEIVPLRSGHPVDPHRGAGARGAVRQGAARPGDFLGTEKDLAERFGVSRIVARDALRTLEAQGIVRIKVGAGGGARIAQGDTRLFAEALAVQLDLAGVSVGEIMDAQRAIECLGAELAALNSTAEDHAGCARSTPRPSAGSATSPPTPGSGASSIWRSQRPRTTACWWCSSFRCSMSPGRRTTRR